jgi:hypothetical protein
VPGSEVPDFRVSAPRVTFAVEATTVAPSKDGVLSQHPNPKTPEEIAAFLADYMPIKYGNSLTNKLKRRSAAGKAYWQEEGVAGLPFVIAVADFHKPASEDELGLMTIPSQRSGHTSTVSPPIGRWLTVSSSSRTGT